MPTQYRPPWRASPRPFRSFAHYATNGARHHWLHRSGSVTKAFADATHLCAWREHRPPMGRPPRQIGAGLSYHVTARGNGRMPIFVDDADRRWFLERLERTRLDHDWTLFAHCLMTNHLHLFVRTDRPTLADGMRDLLGHHARRFNHRHGGGDHRFGRRYWSRVIDTDTHAMALIAYLARNPVAAGLVADPTAWPWSSYPALMGHPAMTVPTIDHDWVLALFHRRPCHARPRVRALVQRSAENDGGAATKPPRPSVANLAHALPRASAAANARTIGHGGPAIAAGLAVSRSTVWRWLDAGGDTAVQPASARN